jgi:Cd2+/Zn2+-exporting ATPase
LDALIKVKNIVFDKTGTLTKGVFKMTKTVSLSEYSEIDLFKIASTVEANSNHPIAMVFQNQDYKANDNEKLMRSFISTLSSAEYLHPQIVENDTSVGTTIYISIDRELAGYFIISDEIKDDTEKAIRDLRRSGITDLYMLTGDSYKIAKSIANNLKLKNFYAELMPEDKVIKLEEIMYHEQGKENKTGSTIFVGDGVNDAPVLAMADIGISMGDIGTDAAIETADIVIMNDSLSKIPEAIKIAMKTRNIIMQNITFALVVKVSFLFLGAIGVASMWEAVFADVGVALLAVLNARRIIK